MLRGFLKSKTFAVILAFFLPIIIFAIALCIYALIGKSATVIFTDAGAQYIDFLAYYKNIWSGEAQASFSLSGMLGSDGLPLIAYYLLSPFNLITLLFPIEALPYVFYVLVFLRIGLAGVTAYFFLNSFHKKENRFLPIIFSTAYALCGFVALYFWNIMWLDAVMLLPLVALGLKRMVEEGKIWLYIFALLFGLISNYYTGYMLGIFSVLWFVFLMILKKPKNMGKTILKYVVSTLGCVAVALVVLLPTVIYLFGGTGSKHIFLNNFLPAPRFFLPDILGQMTTGAFNGANHYVNGLPNIFIGTALVVFLIIFFLNKKIDKKEKILSGILIAILVLSMWIRTLNTVWHGGALEFWFPTRYAFILSFVMVYLAYRGLQDHRGIGKKQVLIASVAYLLIVLFSVHTNHSKWILLLFDVAVFATVLITLYKKIAQKIVIILIAVTTFFDLGLNVVMALKYLHLDEQWEPQEIATFYSDNAPIVKKLKEYDPGFYRVEKTYARSFNDAIALNYRGLSQFSSTINMAALAFLENLGYRKIDNTKIEYIEYGLDKETVENGGSDVVGAAERSLAPDAFLGIKYLLSKEELPTPYQKVFEEGGIKVYQNPYAMPLAMMLPEAIELDELKSMLEESSMLENIRELAGTSTVEIDKSSRDDYLIINADVREAEQELVMTIANTPGWKAYVDGKPVRIKTTLDALMAIPLEKGEHKIELKFAPRGSVMNIFS